MTFRSLAGVLAAGAALSACDAAAERTAEIQVAGNATIEKPAEIFRVQVEVAERDQDRLIALAAASAKLDLITTNIGSVPGLEGYSILSQSATAVLVRPPGCEIAGYSYRDERPADCSPIEAGAVLSFTLEGSPADAAGAAIAYLTEAEVETVTLLAFDVVDRSAAELEVKQAALADAMSTAQALAAQAGVEIGRPSTIRYGDETDFADVTVQAELQAFAFSTDVSAPSVELSLTPPPVPFSADVAVTFEIAEAE